MTNAHAQRSAVLNTSISFGWSNPAPDGAIRRPSCATPRKLIAHGARERDAYTYKDAYADAATSVAGVSSL